MFNGIADQITEAQKEVRRQKVLRNYAELLGKNEKLDKRKKKKSETAIGKISIPSLDNKEIKEIDGLKSFFYAVFENQENEEDNKRAGFIQHYLTIQYSDISSAYFAGQLERILPKLKTTREVSSLERIVKKIKSNTLDKYYYHEVSTMFQFVDKSSELQACGHELDRAIKVGEEALTHLRSILKRLKEEDGWGSWEMFFSKKVNSTNILPSGIDVAIKTAPLADASIRTFFILITPFLSNRDLILHSKNLNGYLDSFIVNIIHDWLYESKIKTALSKTNQILGSVTMMVHSLHSIRHQNKNELSLMEIECTKRIETTGNFVQQKLAERF